MLCGQILALLGRKNKDQNKVKNAIVRLTKSLTLCSSQKKKDFEN